MKIFRTYQELKKGAPRQIFEDIDSIVRSGMTTEYDRDILNIDFEYYFGGNVNLIETYEELGQISTTKVSVGDRNAWATILETADAFDDCRYIGDGSFVVIFMATTDSGGDTYYIPREIADKCHNVALSVKMTDYAWNPPSEKDYEDT